MIPRPPASTATVAAYVDAWSTGPTGREVGDQLILRTARKPHSCSVRWRGAGGDMVRCSVEILPGDRYVEYLGESAGYQSGAAECLPCAAREWAGSDWIFPVAGVELVARS